MPDEKLQSYLAAHYLSGPKADAILARSAEGKPKRKKKRADASSSSASSGLVFKDDNDSWKAGVAEDDEEGPVTQDVHDASAPGRAFRKVGSSSKRTVEEATTASVPEPTEFKAGLRSKEEMKAARLAREARRREAPPTTTVDLATPPGPEEEEQQTVYRDSSGRVIDIAAHEAQLKQLEREAQRKTSERATWSQGLVQKQQRQSDAAALASVSSQTVARRATDDEFDRHFKDQLREDDPALAFLTKKRAQGPTKPKYKGGWPPNRFGIAPGYRWDGVDRGTGFEKAFFERKNALARREQEARAWGREDM
ncbi:Bud13 [Kalmanozyma brasiliensis GHG001]|uniref:Pre-mRNA-splicing factor CWC26 n=1 Tax=Kalmanozyma brasiliensis (strain GHG001) TaxID=1365824 RepID=V5GV88_KALBG|nr:Bud13 [Kalmanozyma brasiliensis GHG001]EST09817.1 Bud13 [Kalmanozyma brasiliensis GHG001]